MPLQSLTPSAVVPADSLPKDGASCNSGMDVGGAQEAPLLAEELMEFNNRGSQLSLGCGP